MSRHVVVNGRELSMNDVGFIDPNSEWSVTVGEDGSVEVNRLDLKEENAKLRELVEYMHRCFVRGHDWGPYCAGETVWVEQRMRELGIEVDG